MSIRVPADVSHGRHARPLRGVGGTFWAGVELPHQRRHPRTQTLLAAEKPRSLLNITFAAPRYSQNPAPNPEVSVPPFEDGFLTDPFDEVRTMIRERYSEWRTLLLQVNRLSVKNQHSIDIHCVDKREVYAAVLFARTLSTTQGTVHLLDRGLVPQARALLRAAIETLFALTAIANDPPVVDKLIETYTVERGRAAKNIRLWKDPGLREIAAAEEASGRLRQFLDSPAAAISTCTLAQKGGLEDWYRTVYMILSWSVHGTAIDLERHIVLGRDGDIAEFRNEPEVDNQRFSWECAIEVQLKALRALLKIFPSVEESAIEPLEAAFQGLAAKSEC